jgi:hypothetical protein
MNPKPKILNEPTREELMELIRSQYIQLQAKDTEIAALKELVGDGMELVAEAYDFEPMTAYKEWLAKAKQALGEEK